MTIAKRRVLSRNSESGVALIVALIALLLITAIAAGMIAMSNTETSISSNFKDEQAVFFAARAGLEEARDRFIPSSANPLTLPVTLPGTNNGVLYITNPAGSETVAPWNTAGNNYPDDEICKEVTCTAGAPAGTPWYTTASAGSAYAGSPILNWKWVRIMQKVNQSAGSTRVDSVNGASDGEQVCWTGTNEVAITAASCPAANSSYLPVYVLTTLAVTRSGSRRMLQYEIASSSFPPLPGAMIFDGALPVYGAPNSNAFGVSGNDAAQGPNAGTGCGPAANQPAVGAYDANSVTSLTAAIPRPSKYTGTGGSPSVQNVSSSLGQLGTVDGLTKLSTSITNAASPGNVYTGNTSSLTNPGTPGAPVINVVKGDLTLGGGFTGSGILLVTGTLTMSGNPGYNGIILVIGSGVLNKNGGGNGTLNGSLLVANMYNSATPPALIPLGANNPPGVPAINWNGGGNASIQYDSCWISSVTHSFPYNVVAERELMY